MAYPKYFCTADESAFIFILLWNNKLSNAFVVLVRSLHENYPPQMFYALMNLVGSHDRARVLNVLAGLSGENAPKETWRTLRLDQAHYDMAKRRLTNRIYIIDSDF